MFPLVRHLSNKTTAILLKSPLTPNQLTSLSLVSGLAAAFLYSLASYGYGIIAGALLLVSYVLDNCDGEIARSKGLTSEFGRKFDDVSDWWVHAAVFIGIGFGVEAQSGNSIWWWFGLAAGLGATINYAVVRFLEYRNKENHVSDGTETEEYSKAPKELIPLLVFFSRALPGGFLFSPPLTRHLRRDLAHTAGGRNRISSLLDGCVLQRKPELSRLIPVRARLSATTITLRRMLPRFKPGHHRRESDQTAKQRKTDRNHQQNAHARRTTVARDGKTAER